MSWIHAFAQLFAGWLVFGREKYEPPTYANEPDAFSDNGSGEDPAKVAPETPFAGK